MVQVHAYRAYWDLKQHTGKILIVSVKNEVQEYTIDAPAEFSAIVDLLRNEEPIILEDHVLKTYSEPPGEGETK